jgi:hypothetical protein
MHLFTLASKRGITTTVVSLLFVVLACAGAFASAARGGTGSTGSSQAERLASTGSSAAEIQTVMAGGPGSVDLLGAEEVPIPGPAGPEGPAGIDGVDGADGADGADGETGPAGEDGADGADGSVGATGPAGIGLTAVDHDGGGFELQSPDGVSYRVHVTNSGIVFEGPSSTQVWSDSSHFQNQTR